MKEQPIFHAPGKPKRSGWVPPLCGQVGPALRVVVSEEPVTCQRCLKKLNQQSEAKQ